MSNLEGLDLMMGGNFTDAGLEHLTNLHNLETLFLGGTQVSDASVQYLTQLTSLQSLTVEFTRITPEGFRKLQSALPDCEVTY
jgi:Leucine-rich repeat (LRR) protein